MSDTSVKSQGQQPPPQPPQPSSGKTGHPQPRRTSPGNSVTLKHHRLARDASLRASVGSVQAQQTSNSSSPRRNSSGESYETSRSDPKRWFDQSNENPTADYDHGAMDVDPPFFQANRDSSEDKPYNYGGLPAPARLNAAQSSSAEDYRSVIDDLTVEIKKLKEELKRYKQQGPDMLRKEKLFEIKIHGLPKRKKRELEMTLRDFASTLGDSPDPSSSQAKKSKHRSKNPLQASSGGSASKHASSSSGSNFRPVDSAYASMSTGAHSSGPSLGRPSMSSRANQSDQKVENFLRDIPEGLFPRHAVMTEREKKKLVVRRLEHLFTGKFNGRASLRGKPLTTGAIATRSPAYSAAEAAQAQQQSILVSQPAHLPGASGTGSGPEPAREAKILPPDRRSRKKSRFEDNASTSNSQGDPAEFGGNGNSSGSGSDPSPPTQATLPEQRPTRVKDLDPDRVQIPSENMEYIRHLGLIAPELLQQGEPEANEQVRPDADGWVYLNLICNMAQLHILNVTPDFVRAAVSDVSTKLQISPDHGKIRWKGGTEGTKFGSDVSGASSLRRNNSDERDSSSEARKRRKVGLQGENDYQSGTSSKNNSKFGPQVSASSESFHYKPLFVHHESSPQGQTSMDDTLSSFGPVENSNTLESRWGLSGSGNSGRKKRRHDGAIIYYNGAPFCTDLCGDSGDVSPTAYMLSTTMDSSQSNDQFVRPPPRRSPSGSSIQRRPLSDEYHEFGRHGELDLSSDNVPDLSTASSDESDHLETEFMWSDLPQYMEMQALEPSGLGGVLPEDHFMVVVTTKRPKADVGHAPSLMKNDEITSSIINRLAAMSTLSPQPTESGLSSTVEDMPKPVEIEYVSGRIKRLAPAALPPPALFYPPFTPSSSADGSESSEALVESSESPKAAMVRYTRKHNGEHFDDYPDGIDLTSGDEDGEEPDDEMDSPPLHDAAYRGLVQRQRSLIGGNNMHRPHGLARRSSSESPSIDPPLRTGGSSAATAGGVGSYYSSSDKE